MIRALRAILKEAASGQAHLSINNRSKFRRSIALHNHCGCVRGYVPQRRACVGLRPVASAGSRVGPLRITATSCRMRSQISPGQSSLGASTTTTPISARFLIMSERRFPPPWTVETIPGGLKVCDANGQSLAYVYSRENPNDAHMANVLTEDEARRIASNIAKLPELMRGPK